MQALGVGRKRRYDGFRVGCVNVQGGHTNGDPGDGHDVQQQQTCDDGQEMADGSSDGEQQTCDDSQEMADGSSEVRRQTKKKRYDDNLPLKLALPLLTADDVLPSALRRNRLGSGDSGSVFDQPSVVSTGKKKASTRKSTDGKTSHSKIGSSPGRMWRSGKDSAGQRPAGEPGMEGPSSSQEQLIARDTALPAAEPRNEGTAPQPRRGFHSRHRTSPRFQTC